MCESTGEGAAKPPRQSYSRRSTKLMRCVRLLERRADLAMWMGHRELWKSEARYLNQALRLHSVLLDIITHID